MPSNQRIDGANISRIRADELPAAHRATKHAHALYIYMNIYMHVYMCVYMVYVCLYTFK